MMEKMVHHVKSLLTGYLNSGLYGCGGQHTIRIYTKCVGKAVVNVVVKASGCSIESPRLNWSLKHVGCYDLTDNFSSRQMAHLQAYLVTPSGLAYLRGMID